MEHSLGERWKKAASKGNSQQVQGVVSLTKYGFPRLILVDRLAM
ncbi:hypothetical protein [Oscillatoria nigro-viridis]|nr:hypothetical protein [Oscillatoria nigro-viridis]